MADRNGTDRLNVDVIAVDGPAGVAHIGAQVPAHTNVALGQQVLVAKINPPVVRTAYIFPAGCDTGWHLSFIVFRVIS